MGVTRIAETSGWTTDPPADNEYAVLPVGVAITKPSACTVVKWQLFPKSSSWLKKGDGPLSTTRSFRTFNYSFNT
jgi:hypothetical protein